MQSWDGLEDVMPEGYKNDVRRYLTEAAERIEVLLADEAELRQRIESEATPQYVAVKGQPSKEDQRLVAARRRLVLQCLSVGMRNDEISAKLQLKRYIVNLDVKNMKTKFKCRTTIELIAKAIRQGFIE